MKLSRIASLLAGIGILAGAQVAHADGTITFNGEVTATTCVVNGGGSQDLTVALSDTDVPTLVAAGTGGTVGWEDFQLNVTGCDPSETGLITRFSGSNVNAGGWLENTAGAGAASSVGFAMGETNGLMTPLPANWATVTLTSGAATVPYSVSYYVVDGATVTSGLVTSSVDFTFTYN